MNGWEKLILYFQYPFVRYALIVGVLIYLTWHLAQWRLRQSLE